MTLQPSSFPIARSSLVVCPLKQRLNLPFHPSLFARTKAHIAVTDQPFPVNVVGGWNTSHTIRLKLCLTIEKHDIGNLLFGEFLYFRVVTLVINADDD